MQEENARRECKCGERARPTSARVAGIAGRLFRPTRTVMLIAMRACVQRVVRADVVVDVETTGAINRGVLVLLGVTGSDTADDLTWLADKIIHLRIFPDDQGKMNRSLLEIGGAMLVVSQFTLYGDCRKGRRPSFVTAAPPEQAQRMYDQFVDYVAGQGVATATGRFGAAMQVTLTGDGPVTMWIDTDARRGP